MHLIRKAVLFTIAVVLAPSIFGDGASAQVTKIRMHLGGYLCGN